MKNNKRKIAGGKKAAETIKAKYGPDFYRINGRKGGKISRTGGFASNKIGKDGLTGRQRASLVGSIGGFAASKRRKETKNAN